MAQLKDTTIQGSARVTDTLYANAIQAKIFNIPTSSNGTTYGPGTNGYVIKSNGTSVYWGSTGSGSVTSVQVQASSPLQSSTSTAQSQTLSTTISFTNQSPNTVLAGPGSGSSAAAPTFRSLVAADIPDLNWSKITAGKPTTLSGYGITDAASSIHTQAVDKGGTNITSYTTGDMIYASGGSTLSKLAGNTTTTVKYLKSVATTSGTAVAPVWAQIAASEISGLGTMATANTGDYATSGHTQAVNKGGTNITSYTIGDILYASAGTTLSKLAGNTTTTVKYLKSVATTSGTAVAPAWAQIAASDISGLGTMATANTGDYATSGHTQAVNKGGTNITSYTIGDILYASAQTTLSKLAGNTTTTVKYLKSVATTSGTAVAPAWAQIAASDITGLGTMATASTDDYATSGHTQAVNKGGTNITSYTIGDILYASAQTTLSKLAGNTTTTAKYLKSVATTSGTAVAPAWTQIAAADISGLGAAATKAVTDNSSNADVTSTDTNLITGRTLYYQLAKKGYTTNTGTVTSVTLTSGSGITVSDSGTAITSSGSRTISITGMNTSSGSTSKCLTEKGTWASFTNNAGTVTSVQVQASSPLQSSTSTAQSASLSTTISFANQDPNKVLAGPSSGSSAAAPTFRALVAADIPNLSWNKITSDKPTTVAGYGITDAVSTSALSNYVAKAGDTMTGTLTGTYFVSTGNVQVHSDNVISFIEADNAAGTAMRCALTANAVNAITARETTVNSTYTENFLFPEPTTTTEHKYYFVYTEKNPPTAAAVGAVALSGDTMTGTLTAPTMTCTTSKPQCIEISGMSSSAGHGGFIDFHYNNSSADYTSRIIESASGTLSIYAAISTSSTITASSYVYGQQGLYGGGGLVVSRGSSPQFVFQNASAQDCGMLWSNSGRIYIRERPSANAGNYTDIVFPAAKTGANVNKYVYTSDNFSLSGTTLTITPPS